MSTFVTLEIEFPRNKDAQSFSGWLALEGYHRKTLAGKRVTVVLSSHGSRFAVITEARKRGSTIIIEGAKDDHESALPQEPRPKTSRPSGRKETHRSGRVDIHWERRDGVVVAAVIGRIDGSTAAEFHQLLESRSGTPVPRPARHFFCFFLLIYVGKQITKRNITGVKCPLQPSYYSKALTGQ